MGQFSQYGYEPYGDVKAMLRSNNDALMRQGENLAGQYGRQYDQEEFEKGLQQQEQQRRAYDSETARMLGQQKNHFLGNLLSNAGGYSRGF